jgi:signal transduction histidine kinase
MPNPDVSTVRALIIDDREEVREFLRAGMTALGITEVRASGSADAASPLLACFAPGTGPARQAPARNDGGDAITDLVRRFTHDVASPLGVVLSMTSLLHHLTPENSQTGEDLRTIHAAAAEVATMVRDLSDRVKAEMDTPGPGRS